jgi:hypothetical protein
MESFTTRDVARLLGLTENQVRAQARAGFLTPERGPRNGYRFSFQDLVLLRTARELAQARVSSRRIRNALCGLARQLPSGRSLTEIKITPHGHGVVVQDGESAWNPESGQLQLDFVVAGLARTPAPQPRTLRPPVHRPPSPQAAWDWFDLALGLEDTDPVDVLLVTLAFGTIGWIDDYRKVVHRNPRGLPARWKFFWQAAIGLSAASASSAAPSVHWWMKPRSASVRRISDRKPVMTIGRGFLVRGASGPWQAGVPPA